MTKLNFFLSAAFIMAAMITIKPQQAIAVISDPQEIYLEQQKVQEESDANKRSDRKVEDQIYNQQHVDNGIQNSNYEDKLYENRIIERRQDNARYDRKMEDRKR